MNKINEENLFKTYPNIFQDKDKSMSQTCMCWGIAVGDGWYKIIREICEEMERVRQKTGIQYIADQVKSKFGGLRFYYHEDCRLLKLSKDERDKYNKHMRKFVSNREMEAEKTCENCGKSGTRRSSGWIRTLCDKCEELRNKETT